MYCPPIVLNKKTLEAGPVKCNVLGFLKFFDMRVNTLPFWQIEHFIKIYLPWVKILVNCQIESYSIRLLTGGQLAVNNHRQKSINSLYFIVAYFRVIVNTYKKRLGLQNITGRSWHFVRDRDRLLAEITTKRHNNPH